MRPARGERPRWGHVDSRACPARRVDSVSPRPGASACLRVAWSSPSRRTSLRRSIRAARSPWTPRAVSAFPSSSAQPGGGILSGPPPSRRRRSIPSVSGRALPVSGRAMHSPVTDESMLPQQHIAGHPSRQFVRATRYVLAAATGGRVAQVGVQCEASAPWTMPRRQRLVGCVRPPPVEERGRNPVLRRA